MRILEPCPYCGQPTYRPAHLAEHKAEEEGIPQILALHRISPLSNRDYIVDCDDCGFIDGTDNEEDGHTKTNQHAQQTGHDVTLYSQEAYQRHLGAE